MKNKCLPVLNILSPDFLKADADIILKVINGDSSSVT